MKTYQEIENELRIMQDSWRHGGRDESKPEGEIAAKSVQFLLREVEREIGLRDSAIEDAEIGDAELLAFKVRVKSRDEYISAQDNYIEELKQKIGWMLDRPAASPEEPQKETGVSWDTYSQALDRIKELEAHAADQIEKWNAAEEASETRTERLSAEVVELLAKNHVLKGKVEMYEDDRQERERQQAEPRLTTLPGETPGLTIKRLLHEVTSEAERADAYRDRLEASMELMDDVRDQSKANRCAALSMYKSLKAAAVMAMNGSPPELAKYLVSVVNFHMNDIVEEVRRLNAELEGQDQDKDDQHITDGEKPR